MQPYYLCYEHFNYIRNNDTLWNSSYFYRNSEYLLDILSTYGNVDFDNFTTIELRPIIRDAMFKECQILWEIDDSGRFTYDILPEWKFFILPRSMYTKFSSSWYYQFRSGHTLLKSSHGSHDTFCRFGCNADETIEHILHDCNYLILHHNRLRQLCQQFSIQYTTKNLLTYEKLKIPVEQLLDTVIKFKH